MSTPRSRKRQWKDDEESDDNPALFRRVRVRYWDQEDDVWEIHRSTIKRLYLEGETLRNIQGIMERDYGFKATRHHGLKATRRQYHSHAKEWGLLKHRKDKRWEFSIKKEQSRAL